MKHLLITTIVLLTSFNSSGQEETITFLHHGYALQANTNALIRFIGIEEDSIVFYEKGFNEIMKTTPNFSSDSVIEFGDVKLFFLYVVQLFDENQAMVKITRLSDGQLLKPKVKYKKQIYRNHGIGGSSSTYMIVKDKKNNVEIVRQVVRRSLPC